MQSHYIWMDGTMVPAAQATVPFLTSGFHYGVGVFEGIRAYKTPTGTAVFRLRDHLERLHGSCHILGFKQLPFSVDELIAATVETVRKNGFDECYIRPFVYLADGGWNLTLDSGKPRIGIAVWQESVYLGQEASNRGLTACVSSFLRHHPAAMMTKAKISGNYVNSVLAKTDAQRAGFDEAILLDPDGYLTECSGANLFLVRHGRILTPSTEAILEGITRSTVMALGRDLGIDVVEGRASRDHLYISDEVFFCGTAAEVLGVTDIDHRTIGSGVVGPVTQKIRAAYQDAVHGRNTAHADWLTHVARDLTRV